MSLHQTKRYFLALLFLLFAASSAHSAACTWTGGTSNNWNSTDTGNWSCAAIPGTGDTVIFDGTSGSATVVVDSPNGAGVVTVISITMGAYGGTLDFDTNDNNVTLSTFSCTGTGARTITGGSGTWTLTATTGTPWNCGTTTNLTNPTTAFASTPIVWSATPTGTRTFAGGGMTYGDFTVTNTAASARAVYITGANTFANLAFTDSYQLLFAPVTNTITGSISYSGTSTQQVLLNNDGSATVATLSVANPIALSWIGIQNITKAGAGSLTATNAFNFGGNTGVTISQPSGGGRCIGC